MVFYGLLDHQIGEVIEFFISHEDARAELQTILADEPEWGELLEIVKADFSGPGVRVERVQ